MSRALAIALVLLVAPVVFTHSAMAQIESESKDDDAEARAGQLFKKGAEALERREYEVARELLAESFALVPRASTAFNLSVSLKNLNQHIQARDLLRALQGGRYGELPEKARTASETLLQQALSQISVLDIQLEGASSAQVKVGDVQRHTTGEPLLVEVNPGKSVVMAWTDGGKRSTSQTVEVSPGETRQVKLRFVKLQLEAPTPNLKAKSVDADPVGETSQPLRRKPLFWIVLLGTIAGAVLLTWALLRPSTIQDDIFGNTPI